MSTHTLAYALAVVATGIASSLSQEAAAEPARPKAPVIVKKGTIGLDLVESTPFVFKDKVYRLEWFRNESVLRIVDRDTGREVSRFGAKHRFPCAYVEGDTVYVVGTKENQGWTGDTMTMFISKDLKNWDQRVAFKHSQGKAFCNTSVCKADGRFVMSYEQNENGFHAQFLESKDLLNWRMLPDEQRHNLGRYNAPHCLRWHRGWFYLFYLEADKPHGYEQYVARSRDLIRWEPSPLNPVLAASPEDRIILNEKLTDAERAKVAKAQDVNNSDIDFCECKGRLVINYSWGNQQGVEFLAEAEYAGTLGQFLTGWFPADETPTAVAGLDRADFYVSPAGSDAKSGVKEQPFRTIEHARDCVRRQIEHQGKTRAPITVWIAAGDYYLDRSLELSEKDSGVKDSPVCYRAEPGAEVRLVGGRRIPADAFKPVEDTEILHRFDAAARGHVLAVDLKALGVTDFGAVAENGKRCEVLFNDKPLTLARWPNEGFVKIAEVTGGERISSNGESGDKVGKFTYDGDRPGRWAGETDIWLHGYWFWDWAEQYQRVETIDAKTRTIRLEKPYHYYGYRKGQRYYAVNVLAELDLPGEWYLDRRSGVLYIWPPEPMEKARIVFSTLASPCISLKNASHIVLRDLIVEAGRGEGVKVFGGKGNLVAGCTIRNMGGTGAVVEDGCKNGVTGCEVYQTGMGGIIVDGGDRATLAPAGNFATNNHIHHFARLQRTCAPAILLNGVGNRAAHNLIHDAPHIAIGFAGNENVMELNEIHDVCRETDDVGVFYTGRNWTVRGNVIRHNFIHHVTGPIAGPRSCSAQGVYLDDCASGIIVFGNVIFKTSHAMCIGGGRDNTIQNNLMLDCDHSIDFDNRGLGWAKDSVAPGGEMLVTLEQVPYRRPPWSEKYPQLLKVLSDDPGSPKGNVIRFNVVSRCKPMKLAKEVSQFGTVANNLTTDEDLGFPNAGGMDFRLRDDSAILKKLPKFERIPFEEIGLQVDEYRKTLPAGQASK
jgi:hypothetical protein